MERGREQFKNAITLNLENFFSISSKKCRVSHDCQLESQVGYHSTSSTGDENAETWRGTPDVFCVRKMAAGTKKIQAQFFQRHFTDVLNR